MDTKFTSTTGINLLTHMVKKTSEYDQRTETGPVGRPVKLAKGEAPKSAMIEGLFGGKHPEG